MKEVNCLMDNTIKLVNSKAIAEIISISGYFEEVEDISDQLSSENTMVFDVYVDLDMIFGGSMGVYFENLERDFDIEGDGLSQKIHCYMDIALEDIIEAIKANLNIGNITGSYSINEIDGGIAAFIYFYFGEYYLNQGRLH